MVGLSITGPYPAPGKTGQTPDETPGKAGVNVVTLSLVGQIRRSYYFKMYGLMGL